MAHITVPKLTQVRAAGWGGSLGLFTPRTEMGGPINTMRGYNPRIGLGQDGSVLNTTMLADGTIINTDTGEIIQGPVGPQQPGTIPVDTTGGTTGSTYTDPAGCVWDSYGTLISCPDTTPGTSIPGVSTTTTLSTPVSTPQGSYKVINGVLIDPSGKVVATGIKLSSTQTQGLTDAQIAAALSTVANSAISAFNRTKQPGVIPGSSLVYNPATGQFLQATGGGVGTGLNISGQGLTATTTNMGMLLMFGIGALVLVMMMQRR